MECVTFQCDSVTVSQIANSQPVSCLSFASVPLSVSGAREGRRKEAGDIQEYYFGETGVVEVKEFNFSV